MNKPAGNPAIQQQQQQTPQGTLSNVPKAWENSQVFRPSGTAPGGSHTGLRGSSF